jgi:hypothetical protein
MEHTKSYYQKLHGDQVNRNNVMVQNWRNDIITKITLKSHNPVAVVTFIDKELIPMIQNRYLRYYPNYESKFTPSIRKEKVISALTEKVEKKFK